MSKSDLERIMRKLEMIFNEINTVEQYTLLKTIMWNTSYMQKLYALSFIEVDTFSRKLSDNLKSKFKLTDLGMHNIRVDISNIKVLNFSKNLEIDFKSKFKLSGVDMYNIRAKAEGKRIV